MSFCFCLLFAIRACFSQIDSDPAVAPHQNPDARVTSPSVAKQASVLGTSLSVADSLKTFSTIGGYRVEIAASEPEIADPVAFDWGSDGELWVVEMGDYPNGADWHGPGDPKGKPGGRIKLLLDNDKNGHYETAFTFLEGLSVPTGVKAFREGILITAAPYIIYATDTDGDHVADKQEILYEGLSPGNEQHRANGLRWGLDHWLHLANGESGGEVQSRKTGRAINIGGRDFKIHPDTGGLATTSGQTQFGRNRDNYGNWFGGNNSEPIWHYVLDESYQSRNPFALVPSAKHITSMVPGAAPVFPTSETIERFNDFDRADRFTSACSTEISRNDASPQQYAYVCEPVHNLVHRSILLRDGFSFASRRAADEQHSEFLASTDKWFRPAMVRFGPDGAIWIADMYRQVIEHPEWIPADWQQQIDHLSGNDQGRIYRVHLPNPTSAKSATPWNQLKTSNNSQLVSMLDSPNGVLRDMAHQELYQRSPPAISPQLRQLYWSAQWPAARISIVNLLNHLGAIDVALVSKALRNDLVNVQILRTAIPQINQDPRLRDEFFRWVNIHTEDNALRIPLTYLLGEIEDSRSSTTLVKWLFADDNNPQSLAAIMSSVTDQNISQFTTALLRQAKKSERPLSQIPIVRDLIATAMGLENEDALNALLPQITDQVSQTEQFKLLSLIAEVSHSRNNAWSQLRPQHREQLTTTIARARLAVTENSLPSETRTLALAAFGLEPAQRPRELKILKQLLTPTTAPELQQAAIQWARQLGDSTTPDTIYSKWNQFSPAIRDVVVRESLLDSDWTDKLLDSIANDVLSARDINLTQQAQLRDHPQKNVRRRAANLFAIQSHDRQSILEEYIAAAVSTGDQLQGKMLFAKHCSACHKLEGHGTSLGPDLTALSDKSRPAMLTAILVPSQAVEQKFLAYTVLLQSGRVFQGMLQDESTNAFTLVTANDHQHTIRRVDIESIQTAGKSFMPDGMEQLLTPQGIQDIIAYIRSIDVRPKSFTGNHPQVAPVRDDGSMRLFAMHAEVYGPNLRFDSKYRNLTEWNSHEDRAVWQVHAAKAGRYELEIDYACSPDYAMNKFQLKVSGQQLTGRIEATESRDHYRSSAIGSIWLPAKPVEIAITSDGPIDGFLFDLRTVVLWPE